MAFWKSERGSWVYLRLFGLIWVYLRLFGLIWVYLRLFRLIWVYLRLFGLTGCTWGYWLTWVYLRLLGLTGCTWGYWANLSVLWPYSIHLRPQHTSPREPVDALDLFFGSDTLPTWRAWTEMPDHYHIHVFSQHHSPTTQTSSHTKSCLVKGRAQGKQFLNYEVLSMSLELRQGSDMSWNSATYQDCRPGIW